MAARRVYNERMSRRERAVRLGLAAVGTAIVISFVRGSFWTSSMLWEIAVWVALFAAVFLLDDFIKRKRRTKRL